ncbi:MAG TPA: sulfatase [Verrucomicrobium sp.]|nr:sulfatase [Verrucomicrobium sp.]
MKTSLSILFTVTALGLATSVSAAERPNVLILLMDDLGRSDLGVDGTKFHETPHMDALANSGVRFTDFYSAHPVCSPTRAALMTGKVPQRVGITDYIKPHSGIALPEKETTLGEAFAEQGYQTGYLGKWHLGEEEKDQPSHHGFSWSACVNHGGQPASYYFPYKAKPGKEPLWDVPDLDDGKEGDYLTDALTGKAIGYLKQRDPARPFLLCFSHYAVHTPIQPPPDLLEKYRAKALTQFGAATAAPMEAPFGAHSRARQDDPAYAALVENLDTNVGRLLTALQELRLRDNTIVILTSDNGGLCTLAKDRTGPTSNLPWRSGKGWNYEGGIRTTCTISWPGHLRPAIVSTPAFTPDLYPTLLDLCSLPKLVTQHVDGRSLASLLRDGTDAGLKDRPLAWYYPHEHGSGHQPSAAIRSGSWKLIHFFTTGRNELYDLATDPGESRDLSQDHPKLTTDLHQELMAWVASTNARTPRTTSNSPSSSSPP